MIQLKNRPAQVVLALICLVTTAAILTTTASREMLVSQEVAREVAAEAIDVESGHYIIANAVAEKDYLATLIVLGSLTLDETAELLECIPETKRMRAGRLSAFSAETERDSRRKHMEFLVDVKVFRLVFGLSPHDRVPFSPAS